MKRIIVCLLVGACLSLSVYAETWTLYTGTASNKTTYFGISLGGNIWSYLQLQFDISSLLQKDGDSSLQYINEKTFKLNDFYGASFNLTLKFPIHLLPYMEDFDYIQPYILTGYGYGLENSTTEFFNNKNTVNKKTGLFSKLRQFDSFGFGLIVMLGPSVGIKIDSRMIKIEAHEGMSLSGRKFNRFSIGLCLGAYKSQDKKK
jgi:hypothetical protein